MNIDQPVRCAIYTRVSTREKGQDVENQIRELEEYAKRREWVIVRVYADEKSGSTDERPQFRAMFEAAARREFDILLFWALDRFSREGVTETLLHLRRLAAYGVDFFSLKDPFLDSCGIFKEAIIGIMAALAKQERVRISERTKAGLDKARARGFDKHGKVLVLGRRPVRMNEKKLRELRALGWGTRRIAKELGHPEPTVRRRMKVLNIYHPTMKEREDASAPLQPQAAAE